MRAPYLMHCNSLSIEASLAFSKRYRASNRLAHARIHRGVCTANSAVRLWEPDRTRCGSDASTCQMRGASCPQLESPEGAFLARIASEGRAQRSRDIERYEWAGVSPFSYCVETLPTSKSYESSKHPGRPYTSDASCPCCAAVFT